MKTCQWIMEEAAWCRQQLKEMGVKMDIDKALAIANHCEDEGIVSTTGLALRCLAKEYLALKKAQEKIDPPHIEFLRNQLGNPE